MEEEGSLPAACGDVLQGARKPSCVRPRFIPPMGRPAEKPLTLNRRRERSQERERDGEEESEER